MQRVVTRRYAVTPAQWPAYFRLAIAVVADIHACAPWMPTWRIRQIVDQTNALGADLIVMLGDYVAAHKFKWARVPDADWAAELARLEAPLGVYGVLGNHDWVEDRDAWANRRGPIAARLALEAAGVPVFENDAVRLEHNGQAFWLAGLGDQFAFLPNIRVKSARGDGVDDLPATLANVTDDAPIVLMVHEPDIFVDVPDRVALTLAGHTHGGQIRPFGKVLYVPSEFGTRYAYGHIVETRDAADAIPRHLIVSGGLGCSAIPVRWGVPPEIVLVELGG